MPRFDDDVIDMWDLLRRLAEQFENAVMDAGADQLCGSGANSRNGYRERSLATCVGTLTLRISKLCSGSFFPEEVIERYQGIDLALVAAVVEMYAIGTSTRKVQRVAGKMGRLQALQGPGERHLLEPGRPTSRSCAEDRPTALRCPTSGSTPSTSSAAARGAWPPSLW